MYGSGLVKGGWIYMASIAGYSIVIFGWCEYYIILWSFEIQDTEESIYELKTLYVLDSIPLDDE